MPKYRTFLNIDRLVATVVTETAQLFLSNLKTF